MRSTLIVMFAVGLGACVAPPPCADDGDCPAGACQNGACLAPADVDALVDMAAPVDARVDADRPPLDARPMDATPDATDEPVQDAALDATKEPVQDAGDARLDAGSADMQVDAAPPCDMEIELTALRPRMGPPLARGEVYSFDVQVDPPRADIELSAPYGEFMRRGQTIDWAPRGGNPGDVPWPWWTGPVELTVTARVGGCRAEERLEVEVAGDVLIFDEVDGAIWVLGSDGRLLGQWQQLPGNGVTAMALVGGTELLAAVRQPDASGHHLIHRLNARGEITGTLATEDFGTGDGLLLGAARSIQVLPSGLITATSTLETELPFWLADGDLSHRVELNGPVDSLGQVGERAIFSVGGAPPILATDGQEALVEIGRNGARPQAIFELHDPTRFLIVVGADWDMLVQYAMGEYANLRPPPAGSDVRAVTRFRDGYLVYDLRNRRLRVYDAGLTHQVLPDFAPDIRQITVAGLLWLDRRDRVGAPE